MMSIHHQSNRIPKASAGRWYPGATRIPSTCSLARPTSDRMPADALNQDHCCTSQGALLLQSRRNLLTATTGAAAGAAGAAILFPPICYADTKDLGGMTGRVSAPRAARIREARMVMRVLALRGSVPQQWVSDFATALEGYGIVSMELKPQISDIWQDLTGESLVQSTAKNSAPRRRKQQHGRKLTTVDAVTLGDSWLQAAILRGAIQPLSDPEKHRYWEALPERFRQLVLRAPNGLPSSSSSQAWGVPYRWGCTLILYRKDRWARWGGLPITDWDDLLHPGLQGRVGCIDSPRELVGIALKTLGLGYNATTADLAACGISVSDLSVRVRRLAEQVKVFSSVDHIRAFGAGEVDVVVGWSDDLIPLSKRNNNAELAAPKSGTALWTDVWCVPARAAGGATDGEPSPLLPAWLEIGLQPVRASRSRGLEGGASPLLLPLSVRKYHAVCTPIRQIPATERGLATSVSQLSGGECMPSNDVLERSEFLLPLDADTTALYKKVLKFA